MIKHFDAKSIVHIRDVDHPESIGVGPDGTAYTTGTGCQVYRIDLETNRAHEIAWTPERCLGSALDIDSNLYIAHACGGDVLKINPSGEVSVYATGPQGRPLLCPNYPAFDRQGNMYLSDSGKWTRKTDGAIYKIKPGGGEAELWYPYPLNTPNAIALDADENYLYFAETFGSSIIRIAINDDGSPGELERMVYMARHIPDGIAFDTKGRLWIACHRPDVIYCFDPASRQLMPFCDDWMGFALWGPTDISFAGPNRDIMLAASIDFMQIHRFDDTGIKGLKLNYPKFSVAKRSLMEQLA